MMPRRTNGGSGLRKKIQRRLDFVVYWNPLYHLPLTDSLMAAKRRTHWEAASAGPPLVRLHPSLCVEVWETVT